jgi:hypothetical protein
VDIQTRLWLLRHESDIAWGVNDYGDLVALFVDVIGRQPVKD